MLVKHAYNESLHLHKKGFKTWVSNVWEITNKYQINIETKTSSFRHIVKNQINEHFMSYWKTSVADVAMNTILRTYNFFKPNFKFETYLEVVKDGSYRHALTKFRTSSHTLEIEHGRHTNTKVNDRALCILWKKRRWKAFYSILRCHSLRAPVSVWGSKLPLPGLPWPWWPWEFQISNDVRKSPNIDLAIKIYLRWISEDLMI